MLDEGFTYSDSNQDQNVSQKESIISYTYDTLFKKLDKDQNGYIDPFELNSLIQWPSVLTTIKNTDYGLADG